MKPDEIYRELRDIADKLGVGVEEHNFRNTGIRVRSGSCTLRGRPLVIIDKHKSIGKKVRILASALSKLPLEDIFIVPAVRELINRYADE